MTDGVRELQRVITRRDQLVAELADVEGVIEAYRSALNGGPVTATKATKYKRPPANVALELTNTILASMQKSPTTVQELVKRTGFSPRTIQKRLNSLMVQRKVVRQISTAGYGREYLYHHNG